MANPDPVILKKRHNDWPWFLRWVPRSWNSFYLGRQAPVLMWGNERSLRTFKGFREDADVGPAPIPAPGEWQISRFPGLWWPFRWLPLYFAVTNSRGWHYRIGLFRGDDIDGYFTMFTIARRFFPPGVDRDTSA